MSENEVTASEVIEHSQGGENEVNQEISEPGETGAEGQEPVTEPLSPSSSPTLRAKKDDFVKKNKSLKG